MAKSGSEAERWRVVIGGIICQFCCGMLYSWSIYKKPIISTMGWAEGKVSFTFSIATLLIPIIMIFAGKMLPKKGPTKVALIGAVCLAVGLYIASTIDVATAGTTKEMWKLYLGYGVLGGVGVGFCYGVPIATCARWFPDKKGLISGLSVAGFGLGSIVYAPIATGLIAANGPFRTFLVQGIITIIGIAIGAPLMKWAPDGYMPAGWVPNAVAQAAAKNHQYSPSEMVRTKAYWFILIMYLFANMSGLMVIGHASPIAQQVAGLTPAKAGVIVSVLAIANTCGRFIAGAATDKFGAGKVVAFIYIVDAVLLLSLRFMSSFALIALGIGGLAVCFGAMMGSYPPLVMDYFGTKFASVNYPLVFLAYGIGGVVGPQIASTSLAKYNGSYNVSFIIIGISCVIGMIMAIISKRPSTVPGEKLKA